MKDKVRKHLFEIAKKIGVNAAIRKGDQLLSESYQAAKRMNKWEQASVLRGELAEIILELQLRLYCQRNPKTSFMVKNLVIPRSDGKYGTTELDLTLFREDCIYLFECKSYSGKKVLEEECLLKSKNREINVYSQNMMHLNNLHSLIFEWNAIPKGNSYQLVLYTYDNGDLEDLRSVEWKNKIPVVTKINLIDWLFSHKGNAKWDIKSVGAKITELKSNKNLTLKNHVSRLKGK